MRSSALFPVFLDRDFRTAQQPGLKLWVEKMTWNVEGGCRTARIVARVQCSYDLDQFAGLLRCPVNIFNSDGSLAWCGFVWSVRVQDDRTGASLSLGDLVNRARTIYGLLEPEAAGGGVRSQTDWVDDIQSQGAYGVKEGQYSLRLASSIQAEAYRDANLAEHSHISPRPVISMKDGNQFVTIDLRGWWETLSWRHYDCSIGIIEHRLRDPNYLMAFGVSSATLKGQQFTVTDGGWRIESTWFSIKRVGNPASNVRVLITADVAGIPGAVLGLGVASGTNLPISNPRWTRVLMNNPIPIEPGTYFACITDTSVKTDANYYRVQGDKNATYAGGSGVDYNGSAWVAIPENLQFKIVGTMETTQQIKLMAASGFGGQFLTGVEVQQASGIYTNPQRTGDTTALEEIRAHLAAGTSTGEKLQATITAERVLRITQRPAAENAPWIVRNDGVIRVPGGQAARPGPDMVGSWAVLDTKWASSSANWLQSPGRVFLEGVEWSEGVCRAVSGQEAASLTEATHAG